MKKIKILPHTGFYYINDIWFSEAYQALTQGARDLLQCLLTELNWDWVGKGKKRKVYTNNGELSFTEIQYRELRKCCSGTYLKARNQLIECGFIKQMHQGGTKRGDRAKYKVLCIDGVFGEERRWKQYPQKNWLNEVPKAINNKVGEKTRFQKGQSGKDLKATLSKHTLIDTIDPIEMDPNK